MSATYLAKELIVILEEEAASTSLDTLKLLESTLISSLAAIRRAYNSKQPVNKLPPEILCEIFKQKMRALFEPGHFDGTFRVWWPSIVRTTDLIPLTHVCCHWRDLALGSPSLWRSIDGNKNVELLLRRAADSPLNVFVKDIPSPTILTMLARNDSRVRELHWDLAVVEDIASPNYQAPVLELLTINGWAGGSVWTSDASVHPLLFNGQTPCLRWLTLSSLPWFPANHMPNLTGLNIFRATVPNALSELLSFLSRTPALVDLVLARTEFSEVEVDILPLSMERLRRLVFVDMSDRSVASFLSHVQLEESTAVHISATVNEETLKRSSFAREMARLPAMTYSTRLSFREDLHRSTVVAAGATSAVCLRITPSLRSTHALTLLQVLPTARIRELWFGRITIDRAEVRRMLSLFPALEVLVVNNDDVYEFIYALVASREGNDKRALCPRLSMLRIIFEETQIETENLLDTFIDPEDDSLPELEAPIKHLHLAIMQPLPEERPERIPKLENLFESVVYESYDRMPSMELPPICERGANIYWGGFEWPKSTSTSIIWDDDDW